MKTIQIFLATLSLLTKKAPIRARIGKKDGTNLLAITTEETTRVFQKEKDVIEEVTNPIERNKLRLWLIQNGKTTIVKEPLQNVILTSLSKGTLVELTMFQYVYNDLCSRFLEQRKPEIKKPTFSEPGNPEEWKNEEPLLLIEERYED